MALRFIGLSATALAAIIAASAGGNRGEDAPAKVGFQQDGSVFVSTNQSITPTGLLSRTEGSRPKDVATAPDGGCVAVLTTNRVLFYTPDGRQIEQVGFGAGPLGLAWAPDSQSLYASASDGKVVKLARSGDKWTVGARIAVAEGKQAPQPAGLAVSPDGATLYAALGMRNAVAVVDLRSLAVTSTIPVGACPYHLALSPDGHTLLVANRGGRPTRPDSRGSALTAGTAIAVDRRTDAARRGTVTVIDTAKATVLQHLDVGRQPAGMAISPDGGTAWVTNSDSDDLSVIDLARRRVVRTLSLRPADDPGFGQMPTGVALSDDGRRLYVTCGGANALAVVDATDTTRVLGWVPSAWYPIDVALCGDKVVVACSKGVGSRPIAKTNRFGVHDNVGSVQFLGEADLNPLDALTQRVAANNKWGVEPSPRRGMQPVPVPERVGEPSVFRHVVYIIKENHTYDTTLGDIKQGNGDPALTIFGESITPNQHAIARQFVLLDNTYTSGTNSADGHQWVSSSVANGYMEQNYQSYARSYPYDGGDALAYSPAGFLWNAAAARGLSVRVYGEFVNKPKVLAPDGKKKPSWTDLWRDYQSGANQYIIRAETDNAALRKFLHPRFIGFPQIVSDQWRADQYLADLAQFEKSGKMPALSIMLLPNDHTSGTSPGMPTPRAAVADNDLALGRVVEAISRSRFWKETLILVMEDDSQLGVDHVDGHRTLAFCVSPYTRRGAVVSEPYTHTSIARTIGLVLGIPPMNRFDRTARPMTACFTGTPDLAPYTHRAARVKLDEMNPAATALRGEARRLAVASARQDFSDVDRADPAVVARAVWLSRKPGVPFPWDHYHAVEDDD